MRNGTKTDRQLHMDVLDRLASQPFINASEIALAVHDGVVRVVGRVASVAHKRLVEQAVCAVPGVRAIAEEIRVELSPRYRHSDAELAQLAVDMLNWSALAPPAHVQVKVEHGWMTLLGDVGSEATRAAVETALRALSGVRGMVNRLRVQPLSGLVV
jgi:osmotically-inducible protein OsmY